MSTTLRGGRLDQPEMPTGEIVLQAPPQLEQHEGASGVLMNAIPMLGSLGSIVLVASIGGAGRHEEVDRAEGSVHGQGEVVSLPASAPDAPRHVGQASRSLSSSDAHDG